MADLQMKTIRYPGINNLYRFMQPDGTYPDLTAGNIISNDAYTEDTDPYLFRKLPYKSKSLEEDLVGATVNWNQLAKVKADTHNGITTTDDGNGIASLSGTASSTYARTHENIDVIQSHKYLLHLDILANPNSVAFSFGGYNLNSNFVLTTNGQTKIVNWSATGKTTGVGINGISTSTNVAGIKVRFMFIDLTQMFGSTIADYVYSLEQATAGSGIAWLKSYGFFTKPYYEYDAGTLKSVNPTAHVTRGVNAWDEEWENGYLNGANGEAVLSGTAEFVTKNFIQVIPNTTYYFKVPYTGTNRFAYYDADKNYVGQATGWGVFQTGTKTIPSDVHFMKFYCTGTTYNNDICINISNPTINGKYFPYKEHTYDLGNVPLYGVFQLADNKLKAYGDVRHAVGGTDRMFSLLDLGTLNWNYASDTTYPRFTAQLSGIKNGVSSVVSNILCSKYKATYTNDIYSNGTDKSIGVNGTYLWVRDTSYTDAATFKQAMSGVMLDYEKATPTPEDTPSFEKIQSCFPNGAEEYITTNGVPVGHDTKYYTDVISNIAGIPEPPSGNGTYELKLTVTDGVASYSWVAV